MLVLRLNRPEARNALNIELIGELGKALVAAEEGPGIRAVVLTGTGDRAFCAGMDLRGLRRRATRPTKEQRRLAVFGRFIQGDIARRRSSAPPTPPQWPAASSCCWAATWSSRPRPRSSGCPR